MNGQPAMISVGQSVSYLRKFEIIVDQQQGFRSETPNAEIASIFNGVLLGVTPVIDDNGFVSLNMVPIKSDIISLQQKELSDGNYYTFPIVNLREASTTVRAHSGDLVILGGLIEDRVEKQSSGLPFLSRLPGFLSLPFGVKEDHHRKVELVIILKIDVLNHEQTV
jgi:MSHA biogenesis protein MshL